MVVFQNHTNFKLVESNYGQTGEYGGYNFADTHEATFTEIGWSVLIEYLFNKIVCAGTLINNRYVLTSAYCVQDLINGEYS